MAQTAGSTCRFFQFEPSELAKVLLCVSLAAFVYERVRRPFGLRQTLALLGLGLTPAGSVFLQPDLGTGIVLVAIALTILFVSGIPWQHFAAIAAAAALIAGGRLRGRIGRGRPLPARLPAGSPHRLPAPEQRSERRELSGEPIRDRGRLRRGGGAGNDATQTELLFLPERHTDFIYAVIGERFGFLGAAFVVFLYAILFWRAIRVMRISTSFYGTMIAGGVLAMLAFQMIVNVGMNLGLMPVTGITLPLMSYGGSSVLGTFLALGLLQAIHAQSRAQTFSRIEAGTTFERRRSPQAA